MEFDQKTDQMLSSSYKEQKSTENSDHFIRTRPDPNKLLRSQHAYWKSKTMPFNNIKEDARSLDELSMHQRKETHHNVESSLF